MTVVERGELEDDSSGGGGRWGWMDDCGREGVVEDDSSGGGGVDG